MKIDWYILILGILVAVAPWALSSSTLKWVELVLGAVLVIYSFLCCKKCAACKVPMQESAPAPMPEQQGGNEMQ